MGEHVIRRGDGRGFPRTFEQRPTTKLDGDELRKLLAAHDPAAALDLNPEIEIVTPRLDDILAPEPPVAIGSLTEIPVPTVVAPAPVEGVTWPRLVFALIAATWIVLQLFGV